MLTAASARTFHRRLDQLVVVGGRVRPREDSGEGRPSYDVSVNVHCPCCETLMPVRAVGGGGPGHGRFFPALNLDRRALAPCPPSTMVP